MNETWKLKFDRECMMTAITFPILATLLYFGTVKQIDAGGCPIVVDLNNNGRIDITGHNSSREKLYTLFSIGRYVEFDIFSSGDPVRIDWVRANTDAFLLDIREGVPEVATGKHLFGTADGNDGYVFANGFEKLATFDIDGDGVVSGEELNGIALWKDDGDAKLEEAEIITLKEIGLAEIPLQYEKKTGAYGLETLISQFQTNRGDLYVEDIWFMTDDQPTAVDAFLGRVLHPFS